ncbi:uncharacterized protein LOC110265373 [Arachis ipaensis]|uniref:uncharacterized protein LOC110265373 n=1 Tax=Arachis ipaensis TaxID=130454 RepID=UPI000A2AFD0E|nr:uncharacterized protein LOC110265373 [Arachis ipaensis]
MSEEKKTIVRDLGFGGLMHIPPQRVHHQVLRELANNFKLGENRLETGYGKKRAERLPKPWIANWSKEQLDERMTTEREKNMCFFFANNCFLFRREKEADLRSTEGRYVSSETIPDVNLGSDDPSSQGHTEQSSVNRPAESMLSLVLESASEPADSNIMVVREETPSEGLAIVPIQVFVLVSQTTTVPEFEETPETDFERTLLLQIEGTIKTLGVYCS